ncbi:MAG: hypothetical protein A2103_01380 [Gammaproteobacteria bacterium GWF2_41_13]|nr:MAG: hypothetical protein A2103_01380 [Gammaproteobacteria bacterium GWF2_41_13]
MQRSMIKLFFVCIFSIFCITAFSQTIQIVYFNDFHGQVTEDQNNPGVAKFVAAMKQSISQNPDTIVLVGGDNYQGSLLSNLTHGAPVSEMMQLLSVRASAVGNHEFDWGQQYFSGWQTDGHFTYLAANILNRSTHKTPTWAKPYLIIDDHGTKIAVIGLSTLETLTKTNKANIKNLIFINPAKAARFWIRYLKSGRAKEGAPNIIIALTHIPSDQKAQTKIITGHELTELIQGAKGLNAVLSAHSHRPVAGTVDHVPVLQAYAYGRDIGTLTIQIRDTDHHVLSITPALIPVAAVKDQIKPDSDAMKIEQKYSAALHDLVSQVIGESKIKLSNAMQDNISPLAQWVCQIIQQQSHTQMVLFNAPFFRTDLVAGTIMLGELYNIMPFDDVVVTADVSGQDIINALALGYIAPGKQMTQYAGVTVHYGLHPHEILSVTLDDGKPLLLQQYYRTAINDFMLNGGDRYDFSQAKNIDHTGLNIRDLVIQHIRAQKIIEEKGN